MSWATLSTFFSMALWVWGGSGRGSGLCVGLDEKLIRASGAREHVSPRLAPPRAFKSTGNRYSLNFRVDILDRLECVSRSSLDATFHACDGAALGSIVHVHSGEGGLRIFVDFLNIEYREGPGEGQPNFRIFGLKDF